MLYLLLFLLPRGLCFHPLSICVWAGLWFLWHLGERCGSGENPLNVGADLDQARKMVYCELSLWHFTILFRQIHCYVINKVNNVVTVILLLFCISHNITYYFKDIYLFPFPGEEIQPNVENVFCSKHNVILSRWLKKPSGNTFSCSYHTLSLSLSLPDSFEGMRGNVSGGLCLWNQSPASPSHPPPCGPYLWHSAWASHFSFFSTSRAWRCAPAWPVCCFAGWVACGRCSPGNPSSAPSAGPAPLLQGTGGGGEARRGAEGQRGVLQEDETGRGLNGRRCEQEPGQVQGKREYGGGGGGGLRERRRGREKAEDN